MSGAYYEKIARINLSTGEIKAEVHQRSMPPL